MLRQLRIVCRYWWNRFTDFIERCATMHAIMDGALDRSVIGFVAADRPLRGRNFSAIFMDEDEMAIGTEPPQSFNQTVPAVTATRINPFVHTLYDRLLLESLTETGQRFTTAVSPQLLAAAPNAQEMLAQVAQKHLHNVARSAEVDRKRRQEIEELHRLRVSIPTPLLPIRNLPE